MATQYKVLGQINPQNGTLTTLYTVPASTQTVISTITVCNQVASAATFTISVQPAGASVLAKHYVSFNTPLAANDTITLTLGVTLAATDIISCSANTNTISFNAFGSEIS